MALDKLVDSTQLDAGLATVANAIRTKGGTSAQLAFPQGMADAIAAIPSGGTPTRTAWYRPSDWPDITSLSYETVEGKDIVVCFLTIDTQMVGVDCDTAYSFTIAKSNDINAYIQLGNIVDGEFIAETTWSLSASESSKSIDIVFSQDERFQILKIVSGTNVTFMRSAANCPAVELVADGGSIKISNADITGIHSLVAMTLRGNLRAVFGFYPATSYLKQNAIQVLDMSGLNEFTAEKVIYNMLSGLTSLIQIKFPTFTNALGGRYNTSYLFNGNFNLREVDLSMVSITNAVSTEYMFSGCTALSTIDISNFDMSLVTYTTAMFSSCASLKNLICTDTIFPSISFSLGGSPLLTNSSLINVANALPVVSTSPTLTLHATPKARLSTIMGTVTDGVFTVDDDGDTTLLSFINNTKGWTVA